MKMLNSERSFHLKLEREVEKLGKSIQRYSRILDVIGLGDIILKRPKPS